MAEDTEQHLDLTTSEGNLGHRHRKYVENKNNCFSNGNYGILWIPNCLGKIVLNPIAMLA